MAWCTPPSKTLEEAGDKADRGEKRTAIEAAIAEAEEAVKGDDKDAIEAATQKLSEASSQPGAEALRRAGGPGGEQAGAGAEGGPEAQAEPAEDVVDAEFEEVKDDDKKVFDQAALPAPVSRRPPRFTGREGGTIRNGTRVSRS